MYALQCLKCLYHCSKRPLGQSGLDLRLQLVASRGCRFDSCDGIFQHYILVPCVVGSAAKLGIDISDNPGDAS
jgi:hypothetical protein